MPTLCRVEYMTRGGNWFLAHHGMNFLHPHSYPHALAERGIVARLTELDDKLQPSGEVHLSPLLAELEDLL